MLYFVICSIFCVVLCLILSQIAFLSVLQMHLTTYDNFLHVCYQTVTPISHDFFQQYNKFYVLLFVYS